MRPNQKGPPKDDLFAQLKESVLNIDPAHFCPNNLTLDGRPFRLEGNGYKPFSDIYRYIALKAIEPNAKPIVLVKGRQVGATTMAAALECYFMACNMYGTGGRPPMRILHLFPTLGLAAAYTKDKFDPMVAAARPIPGELKPTGLLKTIIEAKLDTSSPANSSLHYKKFLYGNQIWIESTGLDGDRIRGRQLCLETELPTPSGFVKLKDVKEGDSLFDERGLVCKVTKVHPVNQTPEAYRLTFDDGTVVDACSEHLWLTHTKRERKFAKKGKSARVKNTKEIFDTLKVRGESNHSIPVCLPVHYPARELLIDPYLLGFWLGDGDRQGRIETADPEVLTEYEHRLVPSSSVDHGGQFTERPSKSCCYRVVGLTTDLWKLGLAYNPGKRNRAAGKGYYHKRIPEEYLRSSFDQRLALLQGIMDSDGCCGEDGRCEFVQVESRKEFAYQVLELIRSLGIKASIVRRESWRYNVRHQDKHRIQFWTTLPIFRLQRKLRNLKNKLTKSCNRFIRSVERIPSKPMRCITVDSPSHLYLITGSFIPTHNTADCAFFDEVQDMPANAIGAVTKILTQAKYGYDGKGVQVYFGTPKQKNSNYWKMWQMSSQQYYHLHCEKCGEYFPLYRPDVDWQKIWLYGFIVKCTHCGHEQDKRVAAENGKWIPIRSSDDPDVKMVGYHINQLYIPHFTRELIEEAKPENSPINTERIYRNEVLGEFYDGEGGTISKEVIDEMCAKHDMKIARIITPGAGRRVYAGFDWGQRANWDQMAGRRQGRSYSCAVVLSAHGPRLFSVDFATRLMRNDPQTKKDVVEEMFRRYSVHLGVGDIGDAFDLTHTLQKMYNEKFLASRAAPKVNGHIKYANDVFPKEIVFERDYYISELMGLLKEGAIKFPYGSYDRIEWLVNHCCSMEIKITQNRSGDPVRHYVKGATPNDGFMALLNAYLAWKFDVTQGFKIRQPQYMKYEVATQAKPVQAIVGYLPKFRVQL
jgi:hypothetical protein